jgi:NitT/TauT family transport system permease protein
VIWYFLSFVIGSSFVLPSPHLVIDTLIEQLKTPRVYSALWSTVWKTLVVLLLGTLIGIVIGFFMGINDTVYEIVRPLFMVIQSIPVVSWLAFVVFLWGVGFKGPILISTLSILPDIVFTTASGIKNIDGKLLEMVKLYKVSFGKIFRHLYLASIVPFIIAAVEISIGNVWKVVLVTEFLVGGSGLGVELAWARQYVDVPRIYAITLIAVVLGLATERLFKTISKRMLKRWEIY